MSDYDFKALNDKEFEVLCADILSQTFRHRFERFKPGRDLGVDGRFFAQEGGEVILQCKHWAKTPLSSLLIALAKNEKPKIDKLNPSRYILALSNPLSRTDKQKISKALSPHIKHENDIFGNEDLNDLLRTHEKIEMRHYKLWLHSATVLQHILNRAILGRSRDSLLEIKEKSDRYVLTSNHERALAQLETAGIVIITGEPGIGKTTLADHLCLHYAAKDFSFLKIEDDTIEAEGVFDADSRQIFYFDDFLGSNYLEALRGHEGSKITNFIKRVVRNKNKRFVLTSRSTILNQGKILYDTFQHEKLEKKEYELKITSLSELDKAKILYNHIWHSDLAADYVEEIYRKKRYLTIIMHANFNPRLISYITDASRLEEIDATNYWSYIEKSLDNPAHIWEHPFIAQQDDFARALIILLVLNGQRIFEDDFLSAYSKFVALPESQNMRGRQDFYSNMKILTGSFFNRYINSDRKVELDLFNPSIGDFVLSRLSGDASMLQRGFVCLRTSASVLTLISLYENSVITKGHCQIIATALIARLIKDRFLGYSQQYISDLAFFIITKLKTNPDLDEGLVEISRRILRAKISVRQIGPFFRIVEWGVENGDLSGSEVLEFLDDQTHRIGNDHEIASAWSLLNVVPQSTPDFTGVQARMEKHLHEMLSENISDFIETSDAYCDFEYGEYNEARERLAELVDAKLEKLGVSSARLLGTEIVEGYDIRDDMNEYFQNSYDGPTYTSGNDATPDYAGEIDDLFDRG